MKTREQWQAETKVIRDMAELIWQTSIPFEEQKFAHNDDWGDQCGLWESKLMAIREEMIDMAIDRDLEDEDYPTVKEVAAE